MAESLPPWPAFFTPPEALQAWLYSLSRQNAGDKVVQRHLLTLRWLVTSEVERHPAPSEPVADYSPAPSP